MRNKIQTIAALLIVAVLAVAAFAARSFLRERDYYRLVYARMIESQDIVDTTGNALAALMSSEIHGRSYVLTGEAKYSKAWAEDTRQWQDEIGTLALMAGHNKTRPFVNDLTTTGNRMLKEVGAVVALYDGGSRDKALDAVRKGAGVDDLDRARDITGKLLETAHGGTNTANRMIINGLPRRSLGASVAALVCLALIGAVLLLFEARRVAKLRSANPAGNLPDRA